MSDSTVKLRLFIVEERDKAVKFSTTPKQDRAGKLVWIPRSQIERIFKPGVPEGWKPTDWRECEVVMAEWIAVREGIA